MEVCVNLTKPEVDILDENIFVEVVDFINTIYIPSGVALAGE